MATFPSIEPDYNAQKVSQPKVRQVKFGDGYEQRLRYGLNQNPKEWTLTFQNISETDSDTIETFLDARAADGAAFDWQPPRAIFKSNITKNKADGTEIIKTNTIENIQNGKWRGVSNANSRGKSVNFEVENADEVESILYDINLQGKVKQ